MSFLIDLENYPFKTNTYIAFGLNNNSFYGPYKKLHSESEILSMFKGFVYEDNHFRYSSKNGPYWQL
jgi:hypothetical protein